MICRAVSRQTQAICQYCHTITERLLDSDTLPAFTDVDPRHDGNLEAWYHTRQFFRQYTGCFVFGTSQQVVVASALLFSVILSATTITKYFGVSGDIDWSDPGPLISLLNIGVVGALVFLAMLALERINLQDSKIVGKLEAVAVETADADSIQSKIKSKKKGRKDESSKAGDDASDGQTDAVAEARSAIMQQIDGVAAALETVSIQQEVGADAELLQMILAEMRENLNQQTILGVVVDRTLIQRVFGASMAVIYVMLKDTIDRMLAKVQKLAPPGFPMIRIEFDEEDDAVEEQCMLSPDMEALFMGAVAMLDNAMNQTCAYNISVSASSVVDTGRLAP